jgi:hypothetical protein
VESKKVGIVEAESRMWLAGGKVEGCIEKMFCKGYKISLGRRDNFSRMTTVNNNVL